MHLLSTHIPPSLKLTDILFKPEGTANPVDSICEIFLTACCTFSHALQQQAINTQCAHPFRAQNLLDSKERSFVYFQLTCPDTEIQGLHERHFVSYSGGHKSSDIISWLRGPKIDASFKMAVK